jgi:hypothetical protein
MLATDLLTMLATESKNTYAATELYTMLVADL